MFYGDISEMANQSYIDNMMESLTLFNDIYASYIDNTTEYQYVYNTTKSLTEFNDSYASNIDNKTESLTDFNNRYASALLPITVAFGLLGVIGICGNIIVIEIYGFGKKFKDRKYRCYVLCLAIIDITTCLTLIPAEIIQHRIYFKFVETKLCKVKCFFNIFGSSAASVCLLIVAVDRYILVCHPFLCVRIRSISHGLAWKLCALNFLFAILVSIPAAMLCGTSRKPMNNINDGITYVYLCGIDPYYEPLTIRYAYRFTVFGTLAILSIAVIIMYVKIGLTIMKSMRNRSFAMDSTINKLRPCYAGDVYELKHYTGGDDYILRKSTSCTTPYLPNNTKILFIVTMVFIVTYFCYAGMRWADQTKLTASQFPLYAFIVRIYFIHNVINPFLYAKMDSLFWKRCKQLLKLRPSEYVICTKLG